VAQTQALRQQTQQGYSLVQSGLTKLGDDLRRFKNLQQLQLGTARQEAATSTHAWLDQLPVPSEQTLQDLYGKVDTYNGNRVPASLVTSRNAARQAIAAKEARISSLVPEAVNPQLKRLGQPSTAMAAAAPSVSPILDAFGQPITTPPIPAQPPSFGNIREVLTRLGDNIGDARSAVNQGRTGAREELRAWTSLYGTLEQALEEASRSGDLTPAAREALQQANAAFKVKATVDDLRGLLEARLRTPEGVAEIFNPGPVLDAVRRPANADLRAHLADIGVLGGLETFLQDLQGTLAAPRNAVLKARELQQAAQQVVRQLGPEEQQALARYTEAASGMQQRLTQARQSVGEERSALGQQADARAGMLRSQADQAAAQGKETLRDLERQRAAIPTPTFPNSLAFGYGPAAIAGVGTAVTGNYQTGL
jgi:hypothetical protein